MKGIILILILVLGMFSAYGADYYIKSEQGEYIEYCDRETDKCSFGVEVEPDCNDDLAFEYKGQEILPKIFPNPDLMTDYLSGGTFFLPRGTEVKVLGDCQVPVMDGFMVSKVHKMSVTQGGNVTIVGSIWLKEGALRNDINGLLADSLIGGEQNIRQEVIENLDSQVEQGLFIKEIEEKLDSRVLELGSLINRKTLSNCPSSPDYDISEVRKPSSSQFVLTGKKYFCGSSFQDLNEVTFDECDGQINIVSNKDDQGNIMSYNCTVKTSIPRSSNFEMKFNSANFLSQLAINDLTESEYHLVIDGETYNDCEDVQECVMSDGGKYQIYGSFFETYTMDPIEFFGFFEYLKISIKELFN